jgi:hypothetical protein
MPVLLAKVQTMALFLCTVLHHTYCIGTIERGILYEHRILAEKYQVAYIIPTVSVGGACQQLCQHSRMHCTVTDLLFTQ